MTVSETFSPQEVAARVRPYATGRHLGDLALRIDDVGIPLRNGYWNIPVHSFRWPASGKAKEMAYSKSAQKWMYKTITMPRKPDSFEAK